MSFHNKGAWMAEGGGHLPLGYTAYDNPPRTEPKRSHQWFVDANGPELSPNKKQAVQAPHSKSTSETLNANAPPFGNTSAVYPSVPSQFMDRLFGDDTNRPFHFTEENISPAGTMRNKGINEQFGNDSSVGLSMPHTIEDPEICLSYGGSRKVRVNQVKDTESGLHIPAEHNSGIGQAYNPGNEIGFLSMGNSYSKEDESVLLMGHTYKGNANIRFMGSAFEKGYENSLSIGHPYNKEQFNAISFGGFQQEPDIDHLARPLNSYHLPYDQSFVQTSETPNRRELDEATASAVVDVSQVAKPRRESVPKKKSEVKVARKDKDDPNSFPWNVKTLISTGILDGVPVKYVSSSGEELCGIIKDTGYLCGCQACNFSKVLLSHTFERHAGCKTKHPNNHIYFENGKSTNQVVEELRSTPKSQLFDAIHTVTGSPINEKAFNIWKDSFQAATRELQRIYGQEDSNP